MNRPIRFLVLSCGIPVILIFALAIWAAIREMQSEEIGTKLDATTLALITGLFGSTAISAFLAIESQLHDLKKELDELKKRKLEVADQE